MKIDLDPRPFYCLAACVAALICTGGKTRTFKEHEMRVPGASTHAEGRACCGSVRKRGTWLRHTATVFYFFNIFHWQRPLSMGHEGTTKMCKHRFCFVLWTWGKCRFALFLMYEMTSLFQPHAKRSITFVTWVGSARFYIVTSFHRRVLALGRLPWPVLPHVLWQILRTCGPKARNSINFCARTALQNSFLFLLHESW